MGRVILAAAAVCLFACGAAAQGTIVVHDPTVAEEAADLTAAEHAFLDRALPAVRKHISSETCGESVQEAGAIRGSFTRAGAKEMLIFYEYCQTANGFGWNGLVLVEGGRVTGNFVSDGAWGLEVRKVPDVNRNGLDEFTLSYSGGLHQGQGGTGVDVMEFKNGLPVGLGWFQSEEFGPGDDSRSWKVTAKPRRTPVFYSQKYVSRNGRKAKPVGKATVMRLKKAFVSKFEAVR